MASMNKNSPSFRQESTCNSANEFPIDLVSSSTVTTQLSNFTLSRYALPVNGKLELGLGTTGLVYSFDSRFQSSSFESTAPTITGGIFETNIYEFVGFDLHWGTVSTQGSEHTIDGKQYAAELHVAMFNKKYEIQQICSAEDCLAIFAFLFQVSSLDNPNLEHFLDHVKKLATSEYIIYSTPGRIYLDTLIPMEKLYGNYYHYSGDCLSKMIVFESPLTISENQLDILRSLASFSLGEVISENFKSIQPLNGRVVSYNKAESTTTEAPTVAEVVVETVGNAVEVASFSTGLILITNTVLPAITNFFSLVANNFGGGFLTFGNSIAGNSLTPGFSDGCPPSECRVFADGRTKCCRRVRRGRILTCPRNC